MHFILWQRTGPCGAWMSFPGCFFKHLVVFLDIMKPLADFDEPDIFVAFDIGPVNPCRAAFAIVAFAIPRQK